MEPTSILIVDDNPSMARTTALILWRKGYAVDQAQDGLAAVEKVRQSPFDVILMDIKMPRMDGVEAYRRIRAIRPGATAIMITAYDVEDLVKEALQNGAYACLDKPVNVDELLHLIEEAASRHEDAGQVGREGQGE